MKHRQPIRALRGFDDFAARTMRAWNVPGMAVGIVLNGRTIHARGYGLRDVKHRLPVTEQTTFAIGSCTKAFTSTALGILVDEGKLSWDIPVRNYVPHFRLHDPVATKLATCRDLLTHRTGLPRHDMVWVNTPLDRSRLFRRLRCLPFSRSFREAYQYNNLMYMAAGVVLEHVAGCPWEAFIEDRILHPLGMTSATFSNVDMARQSDFALGYDRSARRLVRVPHEPMMPVGPAGSMNVHIADMCRWVTLHLAAGKVGRTQIISPTALRETHTACVAFREEPSYPELLDPGYALGWTVQPYRGHRRLTHGGCVDGFNACTAFLPHDGIGVVVLTNVTSSPLPRLIAYGVYDRLLGLEPFAWSARCRREEQAAKAKTRKEAAQNRAVRKRGTRPSRPLAAYAGDYDHPGYGRLTVTCRDRRLYATYNDAERPLEHYHDDVFELVSRGTWPWRRKVTFQLGPRRRVIALAAALQDGLAPLTFRRRP